MKINPRIRTTTVKLLSIFCSLLISALPSLVMALDSDKQQAINIQADAAVVDENSGITIYSGRVTIDQGTLHISADEVKVIMDKREVLQIIASMKPESNKLAHYEQRPAPEDSLIIADAKMITYFLQEERLHLAGQANLKQSNDRFSGELLHYDMAKGIVELKSDGKNRVNITLQPAQ